LESRYSNYGDIKLESSFLVLGRDSAHPPRVTLGFLIVGGPYPVVVDTGYRSNQIMNAGDARSPVHENMIETSWRGTAFAWVTCASSATPISISTMPEG